MRVLWVTPHLPDPDKGGGWSTEYVLLEAAARRHDITLLTGGLERGDTTGALARLDIDVVGVPWRFRSAPAGPASRAWRLLTSSTVIEFWQKRDAVEQLKRAVQDAEHRQRFDLVQVTLGEIAPVLSVTTAPSALFLFDVYGRQVDRELASARDVRHRLYWQIEAAKAHRWERRWYPQADGVACVTDLDAAAINPVLPVRSRVVPVPLADEFLVEPSIPRSTDIVAIIGMLNYRPNIDSVLWFTSEIWPLVRARCPRARLQVVGRAPVDEVRRAVAEAGGELLADVPDALPYYWEAAVVAVPMRLGSGMRNKILHTIATEAPLVATSTAIEGIGLDPDEQLVVADGGARAFADGVVDCLQHPQEAAARAASARAFAERYRIDAVADLHDQWWQETAGLGAAAGNP